MSKLKLQSGFKRTAHPSVYENSKGERVHLFGTLRDANGVISYATQKQMLPFLRLTGGNKRRSLMAIMETKE